MKNEIRFEVKKRLSQIDHQSLEELSLKLSKNLSDFLATLKTDSVIGGFIPFGSEPLWYLSLKTETLVSLPRIEEDQSLIFLKSTLDFIVQNRGDYKASSKLLEIKLEPDILIIPGLAFTPKGERLGRGGGYYDRYLNNFTGKRIGICFETQLYEKLPMEDLDQKVDSIITEKGKYNG